MGNSPSIFQAYQQLPKKPPMPNGPNTPKGLNGNPSPQPMPNGPKMPNGPNTPNGPKGPHHAATGRAATTNMTKAVTAAISFLNILHNLLHTSDGVASCLILPVYLVKSGRLKAIINDG